jgi:cytochrome c biogenesis protein CcdA
MKNLLFTIGFLLGFLTCFAVIHYLVEDVPTVLNCSCYGTLVTALVLVIIHGLKDEIKEIIKRLKK